MRLGLGWGAMTCCRPLLLAVVVLFGCASAAQAETVRRKDGKVLDVAGVTFQGERVQVVVEQDGRPVRVVLRLDQLDPADVLPLWDRTHSHEDAAAVLASADLAMRLGLHAEAAGRYEVAFRLDPTLRAKRDAGLARIRAIEADAALRDVEVRERAGRDLRGAAAIARALLADAALPDATRRRMETLARLAVKLAERADARAAQQQADAADAAAPTPAPTPEAAAPPAPPPPQAGGALAAIRQRLGAFVHRADLAREAAAAVTITNRQAIRHLETAADAYLLARRLVREAPAALTLDLAQIGDDLRLALVTTYLDLADLYRIEARYDEARARVRAALILDPGNEHAWDQRRLIEDDLRNPPLPLEEPLRPAVEFFYWSPSPHYGVPSFGYRPGWHRYRPRPVPYRGTRRYVGRRR